MSDTIKCIAIDDEPLALDVIDKFCRRRGGMELQTFSDPNEGLEAIRRTKPGIAFLDIEMERISGLDIAAQLPTDTCLIFTTAYMDYAVEGFNLDAVDYLHKPFAYSRFTTAVDKAIRRIEYAYAKSSAQSIVVKQEYNNVTIPLDDILYIEAMEGYSKIFRASGICTISRVILKNIGSMLPPNSFVRIHRSYIVSKSKIRSFNRQNVVLANGTALPVGRLYANTVDLL